MYCINYQVGKILPAGTEIDKVKVFSRDQLSKDDFDYHPYISFRNVNTGDYYKVLYQAKFHPERTLKGFPEVMFTEKTFEELTRGLSEKEIKAIKEGVIMKGMSKEAVIISAGYPPTHRTPSMESNQWMFWRNKFKRKTICFDSNDMAEDCTKVKDDLLYLH